MKREKQNERKRILFIIFFVGFILTVIVLAFIKNETYILLLALVEIMIYAIIRIVVSSR